MPKRRRYASKLSLRKKQTVDESITHGNKNKKDRSSNASVGPARHRAMDHLHYVQRIAWMVEDLQGEATQEACARVIKGWARVLLPESEEYVMLMKGKENIPQGLGNRH